MLLYGVRPGSARRTALACGRHPGGKGWQQLRLLGQCQAQAHAARGKRGALSDEAAAQPGARPNITLARAIQTD